jgi:sulfate transport system substrate-binding protein
MTMMAKFMVRTLAAAAVAAAAGYLFAGEPGHGGRPAELLTVSDRQGQDLWQELNEQFAAQQARKAGGTVHVRQAGDDSSGHAGPVVDGKLEADVVTLGPGADLDPLRRAGLLAAGWEYRLPHRSVPFTSPVVFLVAKGNPRQIRDWPDLDRSEVRLITLDPRTAPAARPGLLAAWGSVRQRGGSDEEAGAFVTRLYRHAAVRADSPESGRLVPHREEEVVLTWEKDALDTLQASGGQAEVVYPPISLRGEARVAVLDRTADRRGTRSAAEAYLRFLYSDEVQAIIARHHYRPVRTIAADNRDAGRPGIELFGVQDLFGDGTPGPERLFGEGGLLGQARPAAR